MKAGRCEHKRIVRTLDRLAHSSRSLPLPHDCVRAFGVFVAQALILLAPPTTVGCRATTPSPPPATEPTNPLLDSREPSLAQPTPQPVSKASLQPPDTDLDGIIDARDLCPSEPEARNRFRDCDGCPDEVPEALQNLYAINGLFAIGSDQLLPEARPRLDKLAAPLLDDPELRFEIRAHADPRHRWKRGHDDLKQLTLRQAQAVGTYFISQGVAPDRFTTRGIGGAEPISQGNCQCCWYERRNDQRGFDKCWKRFHNEQWRVELVLTWVTCPD